MTREPGPPRRRLLLGALFVVAVALRLAAVYPPRLEYDAATVALQACQILDGARPIFWPGQAYMGTAGAWLVAGLFTLFGTNTLVLSLLAWTLSALWILASLALAGRFFGQAAAIVTALFWLVPTPLFLYWSATARTDRLIFFVLTPVLLLATHDIVARHRAGRGVAARVLALGLLAGLAFWHNMAVGPALAVCFVVLWAHLGAAWHRRLVWVFAPAWLVGFSPALLYHARTGFEIAHQVGASGARHLPQIARALLTRAFPAFWGMKIDGALWQPANLVRLGFLCWLVFLSVLFLRQMVARRRAGDSVVGEELVVGLALAQPLVLALSSFSSSLTGPAPLLYLLSLYPVAFVIPAAAIARGPRAWRPLLALPLAIYVATAALASLPRVRAARRGWALPAATAVERFPDDADPLVAFLTGAGLTRGHVAGHRGKYVNLAGMHRLQVAQAFEEQHLPYALAVDAAPEVFWIDPDTDLERGFAALGCAFDTKTIGRETVYYHVRRAAGAGEPLEDAATRPAGVDGGRAAPLLDRRVDTAWEIPPGEAAVVIELARPERLSRITLLPRTFRTLPERVLVEGSADGAAWTTLADADAATLLFFSEGRPVQKIVRPRCELALADSPAVRFVRLTVPARRRAAALTEVFLDRAAPGPTAPAGDSGGLEAVAAALAPLRATHLVVGEHRLMSVLAARGFAVEFLPNRYLDSNGRENPALGPPAALDFTRPLAIVVESARAAAIGRRLADHGVAHEVRSLPGHALFLTSPSRPAAQLYWCGFDLLELGTGSAAPPAP